MIRSTLLTDGSSDRVLTKIIDWALLEAGVRADSVSQWADLRGLPLQAGLRSRVEKALDIYPCNLLFIHRDVEASSRSHRFAEIMTAVQGIQSPPYVPVIPVRMQEAWLLCDEAAIRKAAGNPLGSIVLSLPPPASIESIANPKQVVFDLLRLASEKHGRRLKQFNVQFARTLIAEHITDFGPLRMLSSFRSFEDDLRRVVEEHHLNTWH